MNDCLQANLESRLLIRFSDPTLEFYAPTSNKTLAIKLTIAFIKMFMDTIARHSRLLIDIKSYLNPPIMNSWNGERNRVFQIPVCLTIKHLVYYDDKKKGRVDKFPSDTVCPQHTFSFQEFFIELKQTEKCCRVLIQRIESSIHLISFKA